MHKWGGGNQSVWTGMIDKRRQTGEGRKGIQVQMEMEKMKNIKNEENMEMRNEHKS